MSVLTSAVEAVQNVFQTKKTKAIIVGSGIYGMSTALHMLQDGGYEVTVLDKCETLPAPDAASCDLNKIIRAGDYADPYLAQLAIDSVVEWRKPEWEGTYHEAGVIALAHPSNTYGHKFVTGAYANLKSMGVDAAEIPAPASSSIRRFYPDNVPTGDFGGRAGYRNPIGGWAEAGRATAVGIERVRKLGGTVRGGAEVVGLVHDGTKKGEVKGVKLASGEEVLGDVVVLCAGAWTPGLMSLPGVSIRMPEIVATGQSLATIQLTPEEAERYKHIPVVFCLDNGWYVFPPNEHNVMKIAIHSAGHTAPSAAHGGVSVPRTKLTPGAEDGAIPKEMAVKLRDGLREVFPELADKPFIGTRLCWYCDTVTGDWLIDYHPDYTNLFVATGDSGHAFKYAPLIGREILRGIKRQTTAYDRERWSFAGPGADAGADVRAGTRQELKLDELVTKQDLQGTPVAATA